ncbi:MAG: D-glycero-beta-D-manno-heptose 1-phosphate adenylyltransferase [Deltaproteobacteria bacterium]|nr:D-glycero-beta-D-manno-heptose 1-phosphate adenylyltransferase [Candidatus Anaeroferrophillus wilburensis]MBN2889947.1 D-glycero-beta-D-manno-heptose 1-phosphate adenylyltransferase [Deltaproteobacteria bacterium]
MKTLESHILSAEQLKEHLDRLRHEGKKVVFTNGCFDLLHPGHVTYLEQARGLGDLLVVAINSDQSVRRLKGNSRPILNQQVRSIMLAALRSVDFVTIFDDSDPLRLITLLEPDILVKGGDWPVEEIVGHQLVASRGGQVYSLPFVGSYSTSSIIHDILSRYRCSPE